MSTGAGGLAPTRAPAAHVVKPKKRVGARKATPAAPAAKELPTAHVGQAYFAKIENIPGLNYEEPNVTCTPTQPGFPEGLSFDRKKLIIAGIPVAALVTPFPMTVVCVGAMNHPVSMRLLLPIHVVDEVVDMSGAAGTATSTTMAHPVATAGAEGATKGLADSGAKHAPTLTQAELDALQVEVNASIVEGATSVSGHIKNFPVGVSTLAVQLVLTVTGQPPSVAALKSPDGGTMSSAPVDASKGTFSFSPVTPLGGGQKVEVQLVPPPELTFDDPRHGEAKPVELTGMIPKPHPVINAVVRAGATTIAGTAYPVADRASTPPPATQLPNVAVLLHDYGTGKDQWYPAPLTQSAGGTALLQPIKNDGTYSATLATALANGQRVKVRLTAPPEHYFEHLGPLAEVESTEERVLTTLAVTSPALSTILDAGTTALSGSATPSVANGATVNVGVVEDSEGWVGSTRVGCVWADKLGEAERRNAAFALVPLTTSSGTTATYVPTTATGAFTLTLANPLIDGQKLHLVQIFPAGTELTDQQRDYCDVGLQEVRSRLDWGRVHADFTVGVLISNDSGNSAVAMTTGSTGSTGSTGATGATGATVTSGSGDFSQAHQFYDLSVEKFWKLPGRYLLDESCRCDGSDKKPARCAKECKGECADAGCGSTQEDRKHFDPQREAELELRKKLYARMQGDRLSFVPGFASFFDARLTAIPISTVSSSPSTTPTTNALSTSQTAKVEVGAYFPIFAQRWSFADRPNALFVAPMAKVGFNTVTGPQTVSTVAANGSVQQQTLEQLYNFWGYGARIGHMELTRSRHRAPETLSYLDIIFGPYSNLQSFLCKPATTDLTFTNSQCSAYGAGTYEESRKRIYRLDLEGLLKVPKTPLYVGFNANIGQKTIGAARLDHGYAAPDDLRFLFGTKFDIAALLNKFNLGAN